MMTISCEEYVYGYATSRILRKLRQVAALQRSLRGFGEVPPPQKYLEWVKQASY